MTIEADGYNLICDRRAEGLVITGYEGGGAVLDLSGHDAITGIDKKAFLCCNSLKRIILPKSVGAIGDWCFSKCENLNDVTILREADGRIFGKGVFDGCGKLGRIFFAGPDEGGRPILLAAAVGRMQSEHLLRADDIGEDLWYGKWDISLMSMLNSDDGGNSISAAVSGEEDISYDGVASVDGEMPGASTDYIRDIAKNKCHLCYMRLIHDRCLSDENRLKLQDYIREHAYGMADDRAWLTLKEDCEDETGYYEVYLDIVNPDNDDIKSMIEDLGPARVQAKALLISRAGAVRGDNTVTSKQAVPALDALML